MVLGEGHPAGAVSRRIASGTSEKVADLDALADKATTDLQKLILAGKISRQEGIKQLEALGRVIPDRVLAALTDDQRKKVKQILGTPYEPK
jgi:hypothetical protein